MAVDGFHLKTGPGYHLKTRRLSRGGTPRAARKSRIMSVERERPGLSEQIREAIRRSGKTQKDIAALAGISKGQLSLFMRGRRSILLLTAEKLCEVLGLELRPRG